MAGHRSAGLARATHVVPVDRRLSGPQRDPRDEALADVLPFTPRDERRRSLERPTVEARRGVPAPVRPPLSRLRTEAVRAPAAVEDRRIRARALEAVAEQPAGSTASRGSAVGTWRRAERPALVIPRDAEELKAFVTASVAYLTDGIDPQHRREAERLRSSEPVERPAIDGLVGKLPEPLAPARWSVIAAVGLIVAAVASGQA